MPEYTTVNTVNLSLVFVFHEPIDTTKRRVEQLINDLSQLAGVSKIVIEGVVAEHSQPARREQEVA